MGRNNRDRHDRKHRSDSNHMIGESKPGDVGDSEGTFHDRARENSNVIVNGEVQSLESYEQSPTQTGSSASVQQNSQQQQNNAKISQSEAEGMVVELTVEKHGGTLDTMARFKNHQVHIEGGTPGERINIKLEGGSGYLIGRKVKIQE